MMATFLPVLSAFSGTGTVLALALSTAIRSLGVDKVALSEASALNLHDNAAIPVHAMTVKKAAESYGWENNYPAEVVSWLSESTDVSDAIIWTETAAA